MQLRQYLAIIRRYWPIIATVPLLVTAISLAAALARPVSYSASARLMLTQALVGEETPQTLRDQWESSEFLIDDVPQVVTSNLFAQDVAATELAQQAGIDNEAAQAGLSATTFHRSVTLQASANSPERAMALAQAAVQTLEQNGLKYWGREIAASQPTIGITVLDTPTSAVASRSLRGIAAEVLLRTLLAVGAGVGLAFLLHYLDTRLRSTHDVEEWLGLPVLGAIPKE